MAGDETDFFGNLDWTFPLTFSVFAEAGGEIVRILGFAFSGHPEVFTCQHLNQFEIG